MRRFQALFLLVTIILSNCENETKGQQPDNTKPMYGEVAKSEEYKKVDEEFKKESLEKFKTIDSSVHVHIDQAWRYFYNNDLKTAMKRFNQAWLLNGEYPDSYFGFAALLDMQKNDSEARRFYKMALTKDKNKDRAEDCYQRIADCKEQLQDLKGTIDAYTRILEINSTNALAAKKTGFLQMEMGNTEAALIAYKKAIQIDPRDAVTFNNRGYLYQNTKNYPNAISDYTKAIELDPKYISAYVNRGISQIQMNNYEAAKKDFEISVTLDSKTGELRRFLGLAKLGLKNNSGACKDFQLAKQLGDTQADELIKKSCK